LPQVDENLGGSSLKYVLEIALDFIALKFEVMRGQRLMFKFCLKQAKMGDRAVFWKNLKIYLIV
jgi:hypothetical protein